MPVLKFASYFKVLIFLFVAFFIVKVGAQPSGFSYRFITDVRLSAIYNDNLIIGTETRSPIPPFSDQILNYAFDVGIDIKLPRQHFFVGKFSFNKENEQQVTFLRRTDQLLTADFGGKLSSFFRYQLTGKYQMFDFLELSNLNFNQSSLLTTLEFQFPMGLKLEAGYSYMKKSFIANDNNVTGFSLVGAIENKINFRAKKWVSDHLRLSLRYLWGEIRYNPTRSVFLNNLSGLSATEGRVDQRFSIQPEALVLLLNKKLLLNFGYQIEGNNSNSDYYDFFGLRALGDVSVELHPRHTLTLETSYGVYDYSRRQFDTRYKNTKEDFRSTIFLTYQWDLSALVQLELNYQFMKNDSNDSIDYDPLTSRSYSTFSQNLIKATLRLDIGQLY